MAGLLGGYRLVTVTGPGGVGKTRLAGEVARPVAGRFADGAWLVELAAVPDPALVQAAVATALGIAQAPGTSLAGGADRGAGPAAAAAGAGQLRARARTRRRSCAGRCWRPPMTCGCWRPAGSRSGWRGKPGTGCRR